MKEVFEMSDLGSLSTYLGIEIDQRPECICLSNNGGDTLVDPTNFQSIFGSLRYLTHTRPDLLYSFSLLSRYMETPTSDHLSAAKRILRYVKGTLHFGLIYLKCQIQDALVIYGDSDFSGEIDYRKSISGHGIFHR